MDLKQRLARLDRSTRHESRAGAETAPADPDRTRAVLRSLGLACHQAEAGTFWRRDYRPAPPPAPPALSPLHGVLPHLAEAALPAATDLLFLDVETTGLAGGTGSLAFLVGLAWWADEGLVVRQYFLEGPGRETPLLSELGRCAGRFTHVVTFNGGVFDLPLLRTRALMVRLPDPLGHLESWDLLPACRRLWGRRLPDCRQLTLERALRGDDRGPGDIDGSQIPLVYFRYLREGVPDGLDLVLQHNQRDMLGMAEILLAVSERASLAVDARAAAAPGLPWEEAWACGRVCERRGEVGLAAAWMAGAWSRRRGEAAASPPAATFLADAVRILKRRRAWDLVAEILDAGLGWYPDLPWLHREAAILYEHRLRSLERALAHARALGESGRVERLERKRGAQR